MTPLKSVASLATSPPSPLRLSGAQVAVHSAVALLWSPCPTCSQTPAWLVAPLDGGGHHSACEPVRGVTQS
eukprot:3713707-Karenia_brevis.AAC.1